LTVLTRYCGLSLPTLFKRISIMAVDVHPLPTSLDAARLRRVSRPELAWQTGNPSLGPYVQAGLSVKKPPTIIASGPAHAPSQARRDNRKRWWSPSRQAGPSPCTHTGDNA
jgi:hypothetical protein